MCTLRKFSGTLRAHEGKAKVFNIYFAYIFYIYIKDKGTLDENILSLLQGLLSGSGPKKLIGITHRNEMFCAPRLAERWGRVDNRWMVADILVLLPSLRWENHDFLKFNL